MTEGKAVLLNNKIETVWKQHQERQRQKAQIKLDYYLSYYAIQGESRQEALERITKKGNKMLLDLIKNTR